MSETRQITDRQLKFSYWFLSHKLLLRRIRLWSLIALNAGLYAYVLISSAFLLTGLPELRRWPEEMLAGAVDWKRVHTILQPRDLSAGQGEIVTVSPGVYDIVIDIHNTNSQWYAKSAAYTIIFAGQRSDPIVTTVLPNQTKKVYAQNFRSTDPAVAQTETARIQFSEMEWQRVDDVAGYSLPKFDVDGVKIELLSNQITNTRVTANVTNVSLTGFREAIATVIIRSNGKIAAVNSTTIQNFLLGETRPIDVRFTQSVSGGTPEVIVTADNLDQGNSLGI
ncbi:MAG: hypothetical protein Q8Q20_05415 [bacterium]|nr:hypothetical protein [bacterium]